MNREIKFRAFWNHWYYSDSQKDAKLLGTKLGESIIATFFNHFYAHDTLSQYTGLKDKNGREIFEGDLVRWGCGFTGRYDDESWHRHAIVELFPSLQFKIYKYFNSKESKFENGDGHVFGYANFVYKKTELYFEVIGNIHENPELLK